jgi:predicted nucleic acid-binding Zn ribbon protein
MSRNDNRANRTEALSGSLESALKGLGLRERLREYDVLNKWEDVVGEQIARNTAARTIEKGILLVEVSTGAWRQELHMRKADIIKRLNEVLGTEVVKDIKFR